jgi:hyaluronoglucosaminidase
MVDQLHIGPIRGRDPDLHDAVSGVLVNPALQAEASLIPLATWADYLRDPQGYDPDSSWQRALLKVCGNQRDADVVAALARAVDRSAINQPWRVPDGEAVDPIAHRAGSIANRRLARDLSPFVAQLPSSESQH